MKSRISSIAAVELLLIFPAILFMAALFVRNLQPQQYEPAHSADQIVTWYAERPHVGLWILLIALPVAVLVSGCATLLAKWRSDEEVREVARKAFASLHAHLATVCITAATIAAGGVLAIVALHVLTD